MPAIETPVRRCVQTDRPWAGAGEECATEARRHRGGREMRHREAREGAKGAKRKAKTV